MLIIMFISKIWIPKARRWYIPWIAPISRHSRLLLVILANHLLITFFIRIVNCKTIFKAPLTPSKIGSSRSWIKMKMCICQKQNLTTILNNKMNKQSKFQKLNWCNLFKTKRLCFIRAIDIGNWRQCVQSESLKWTVTKALNLFSPKEVSRRWFWREQVWTPIKSHISI